MSRELLSSLAMLGTGAMGGLIAAKETGSPNAVCLTAALVVLLSTWLLIFRSDAE